MLMTKPEESKSLLFTAATQVAFKNCAHLKNAGQKSMVL